MKQTSEIDDLFKLPLAEFTAARNSLAVRLKREGRTGEAGQVKSIAKPTATAWAVNQLFWRERKDVERLLTTGEKVRKAQTVNAADLRALLEERRALVSQLTNRGAQILRDAGHAASQDATRKMAITLESLASWGRSNDEQQAGRLTTDLEPLGFDGLAALLDGKTLAPANVLQFRQAPPKRKAAEDEGAARARAKEAAQQKIKEAEKALIAARREAERAEAALAKANARAEALEQQKREIEDRCRTAQEEARDAAGEAKKSAQLVAEAARTLERARAALH
jgi:chromosome segregation ATPase